MDLTRRSLFALAAAAFLPKPKLQTGLAGLGPGWGRAKFRRFGKKIGETIMVRKPARFLAKGKIRPLSLEGNQIVPLNFVAHERFNLAKACDAEFLRELEKDRNFLEGDRW